MIYPTYGADGQPDYAHMSIWILRCDQCSAETLAGDAEQWHQGFSCTDPVYCPADVAAIAKRLVDSATPRRCAPLGLGLALAALIAVGVLVHQARP